MHLVRTKQSPVDMGEAGKRELRSQFAALCYRMTHGTPEILLVTSRRSRRWIIPKGWPVDGITPANAAAQEAFEEAGVEGKIRDVCLGIYSYSKQIETGIALPCMVAVFPIKVKALHNKFPEAGERKRKWFAQKKAAARVEEPELRQIIRAFDPKLLK